MADLKEKGVILLATGNLPLNGVTAVTLYTVPVGKTCILDKLQVVASADMGATVLTVGRVGALTDFLPSQTVTACNGAGSVARLAPVPNATTVEHFEYAAAVVIQANVTTANGSATNTYYLYGTLDDA